MNHREALRPFTMKMEPAEFDRLVVKSAADFGRSWTQQGTLALELAHIVQALARLQREDVRRELEDRGIDPVEAAEKGRAELARVIGTLTGTDLSGLFDGSEVLH
jgi:hypothetical protein